MKILATIAVIGALAQVSSCNWPFTNTPINLSQVQQIATGLCSVVPDLPTVNAILNANGSIKTAEQIAQVVCQLVAQNAVSSPPAAAPSGDLNFVINYNGKQINFHGKVAGH